MSKPVILCVDDERIILASLMTQLVVAFGDAYIYILLTGQADEVAIDRAKKQANLHRCLSKPWSEADLLETIKSGLSKL